MTEVDMYSRTRNFNFSGSQQMHNLLTDGDGYHIKLTAQIVAAYVSKNVVSAKELPQLILRTHEALNGRKEPVVEVRRQEPAVPINMSLTRGYLVCLEDGKRFKLLKRHLRVKYNLSPEDYRKKWGLPSDYPMVAPSYSHQRSNIAKNFGLREGV
jgi:predicted transcriptional regulator